MARRRRVDEAGGIYHVLNRRSGVQALFNTSQDYEAFEQILVQGLEQYEISLFTYELMPNHWHLVLQTHRDREMGAFVKWICTTHTVRHHLVYETTGRGHIYQGRYKSFPIQSNRHFLTVCRYVDRNAVRAGLSQKAETWRWGGLWQWVFQNHPDNPLLNKWPVPRPKNWVDLVNQDLPTSDLQRLRLSTQKSRPFGDQEWVALTVKRMGLSSSTSPRGGERKKNGRVHGGGPRGSALKGSDPGV